MFKYYDPVKHWRKIKPHLSDPIVMNQLYEDFSKYVEGRFGRFGHIFKRGEWPLDYESVDWQLDRGPGRPPAFHKLVKHGACHWLVNTNLLLAQRAEPKLNWSIITSEKHSTVHADPYTLFDLNFTALGIDPDEAFDLAMTDGVILKPGNFLVTGIAEDA